MRTYAQYLNDQMYYWKKKLDNLSKEDVYKRSWIENMYGSFKEQLEKHNALR